MIMKKIYFGFLLLFFLVGNIYAAHGKVFNERVLELPRIELLPTNSLYKLQQLRDRLVDRFLILPDVKLTYYIQMSEKKLHEYVILRELGESDKASRSGSDGSNYLTKFVSYFSLSQEYLPLSIRAQQLCAFFMTLKRQREIITLIGMNEQNANTKIYNDSLLSFLSMHEDRMRLLGGTQDCITIETN